MRVLWILALAHIAITWLLAVRRGWRARQRHDQAPPPPPVELPPVSVIVPAWNEQGTVERNIAALRQVQYPCWEAIIVAGGDDGTYEAAVHMTDGDDRFRVLPRGPEPKNAALNQGIQAARFTTLVLLDADCVVEREWLRHLVTPLAEGASAVVGNRLPNQNTWVTLAELMRSICEFEILGVFLVQGDRSIAIRRETLEKVGGLPMHPYAREDWDLGVRLEAASESVVFAKRATLTTDRPATLRESWNMAVRWHRTHLTGMWEHRSTLIQQPANTFRQVYGYVLSAVLALSALVGLGTVLIRPALLSSVLASCTLGTVWLCGRAAAAAGSVAAYTGDRKWLLRAWMPAVNLLLAIAASIVGSLTPTSLNSLYKGPRHKVEEQ